MSKEVSIIKNAVRDIKARLAILDEKERKVLSMWLGIGLKERKTLEEIGNELGFTRQRAQQIKDDALEKIKDFDNSLTGN